MRGGGGERLRLPLGAGHHVLDSTPVEPAVRQHTVTHVATQCQSSEGGGEVRNILTMSSHDCQRDYGYIADKGSLKASLKAIRSLLYTPVAYRDTVCVETRR